MEMNNQITEYITPSGYKANIRGPIFKYSSTLQRNIAYEGCYGGYLQLPHTHIVAQQISKHVRNFRREANKLNHRLPCFNHNIDYDLCTTEPCNICQQICHSLGSCNSKNFHHSLTDEYEEIIKYFYGGTTFAEEPFDRGYDLIGFDTSHSDDLHIKICDPIPPELIRNTWNSIKNDNNNTIHTIKTKEFVKDCLNLASEYLAKLQQENDEIWKGIVLKIVIEWDFNRKH